MSNLQKNLSSKPQIACKRLIDTLWAVSYEEIEPGKAIIIGLTNSPKLAYSKEYQLPTYRFIEKDDHTRTVIAIQVTHPNGDVQHFTVINQMHVFSYMTDFGPLHFVQDGSNEIKSALAIENKGKNESDFVNAANQSGKTYVDGMLVDDIEVNSATVEFSVGNGVVTVTRDHIQWSEQFMLGYFRNVESPSLDKKVTVKFA
ncbi:hypothetical protein [Vibrio sp. 10N.239.312.D08]|uniref:hypothetical protein n=1 Tax=Vibrio sp. 10N.239.312.D08 TaxID=3229978 RepID=UPI00354FDA89